MSEHLIGSSFHTLPKTPREEFVVDPCPSAHGKAWGGEAEEPARACFEG